MRPGSRVLAAVGGGLVLVPAAVVAAGWPAEPAELAADWRGPGGGLAILPAALWWLCVLVWVRTVDWVSRDATTRGLAPAFWSTVCGLPLPLTALLAWWIPWSAVGIALMILATLVPVAIYAKARNATVRPTEQILTAGHARRIVAGLVAPLGIEIGEPVREEDTLPTVGLVAAGGKDAAENEARLEAAASLPGFEEARRMVLAAVVARATTLVLENATETKIRQEVDGVWGRPRVRRPPKSRKEKEAWVEAPASSRGVGDAVAAALKTLAGLAANAATGSGPFAVTVDGKPRNARLNLHRSAEAEQLSISIEAPTVMFRKFADLGMDDPLAERLGKLLAAERGLILLSSPAANGLSTTFDLAVESADRLLRDFVSIEDAARPPREIQNVKPVRFDTRTGVSPAAALADSLREYPKVIVTRDVRDKDFVVELVRLAGEGYLVIMSLKAADACEAVARVLGCGVSPRQLGSTLLGSLSQRLVRRLCPKCREQTPPPQQLLARLKRTPEQVPHIHKASAEGCRLCGGSGYLGRTAAFELASGTDLRKAIAAGASPEQLRQAARADGMTPLQDAGLALVVGGTTSLDEVQRALSGKTASASPAAAAVSSAPAQGPAAPAPRPATGGVPAKPPTTGPRRSPPAGPPPARSPKP
jgi:hypothetical protein